MEENAQPVGAQNAPEKSEKSKNYLRHKSEIKKITIVKIVAGAIAFIALLLLLFVPNFDIDLTKAENIEGSLPKLENMTLEEAFSLHIGFSIFDELIATFGVFGNMSKNPLAFSFSIYSIAAAVFIIIAFVLTAISLIKDVMALLNFDDSVILAYDKLKQRNEGKKKRVNASPMYYLILAVVFEIFNVIFNSYISGMIGSNLEATSYFQVMTGLSGASAIAIIFLIAAFIAYGIGWYLTRKEKMAIIKEEYEN